MKFATTLQMLLSFKGKIVAFERMKNGKLLGNYYDPFVLLDVYENRSSSVFPLGKRKITKSDYMGYRDNISADFCFTGMYNGGINHNWACAYEINVFENGELMNIVGLHK